MLVDAGSRGYGVFAMTKVWTTTTEAERTAWYKYLLASYLLGNDGRSWFVLTFNREDLMTSRRWARVDLGDATGPYGKINGIYQRSFARGRVLVNPTTATQNVSLGSVFSTLSGASVSSITLGPNSAEILVQ
jgi:hypothetical protein